MSSKKFKPRNENATALESSLFRQRIVPNKKYSQDADDRCISCGENYEDCICDDYSFYEPYGPYDDPYSV